MGIKVFCIGDLMLDIVAQIPTSPHQLHLGNDTRTVISTHGGGAGGNVASWLAVLGNDVTMVGRIGDDAAGSAITSEFDALGISYGDIVKVGLHTGVVICLVDPSGERTMLADNGANAGLVISDLPSLDGVDAIYVTGYALLAPASRPGVLAMIHAINLRDIPIIFDPATVGGMKDVPIEEILSWCTLMDTVIMNEEEAIYLSGSSDIEAALDFFLEHAPRAIIKRGSQGAIGRERRGELVTVIAQATQVVDTTGAGDSFAAGFIDAFRSRSNFAPAIERASAVAAHCVAIVGARGRVGTQI
jgi:sugar/nucleoside kinase (ribokinase family)|uniref:carbohydrate kinase family protein n=1 Tax=Candidatus Planktophila sp. TaxID=2175601 RepID=UPI00404A76DB